MQITSRQMRQAVDVLKRGGVVVYPTETSYGFAADATNTKAVEKVMKLKQRDLEESVPMIAPTLSMILRYMELAPKLKKLARKAWPAPLTLVGPAVEGRGLADGVIRKDGSVAMRISSHPVAIVLSRRLGKPIISTSANITAQPPAFSIKQFQKQFEDSELQPDLILDAGRLAKKKPSTIVTEENEQLVILRKGAYPLRTISHQPKKSFGQHFLHDKNVVQSVVDAAEIEKGDIVLEIGPGEGVLTEALVNAGAKVIAIESDKDLIPVLNNRFGEKIQLVKGDALNLDASVKKTLKPFEYKIVSNLPYNITSLFLEQYLSTKPKPSRIILMLQKEVVDKAVAKPPQMSLLSVMVQLYAEATKIRNVKKGAFQPPPKVDSAVIRLDLFQDLDEKTEKIIGLAKAGFSAKRKQLRNNLVSANYGSREEIEEALKNAGLKEQERAERLTPEDWRNLAQALSI